MGDFLRSIGSNVREIKHIQLEFGVSSYFTNCLYLLGPDEGDPELLHDALNILGDVHGKHFNLKIIEVTHSWKAFLATEHHYSSRLVLVMKIYLFVPEIHARQLQESLEDGDNKTLTAPNEG